MEGRRVVVEAVPGELKTQTRPLLYMHVKFTSTCVVSQIIYSVFLRLLGLLVKISSIAKLEVDVEIKSLIKEFWQSLKESNTLFPKILPNQYNSIEVLEGDGKTAATVKLVKYAEDLHIREASEFLKYNDRTHQMLKRPRSQTGMGQAKQFPISTFSKERIDEFNDASKMVAYSIVDGEIANVFKIFKAKFYVTSKGNGESLVKWSCEFEKPNDVDSSLIKDYVVKSFQNLDAYLLKA